MTNFLLYLYPLAAVYGLAVQQIIELLDAVTPPGRWKSYKKAVFKVFAAAAGSGVVLLLHPGLLAPLEVALAGLSIAAAAEIWNSLLKFLVYAKEARKAAAALALSASGAISMEAIARK